MVKQQPRLFGELILGLWHENPIIRLRAADASEKASRHRPELLQPFKAELVGLLAETAEQELRWHLAQIVPRLKLTPNERSRVVSVLRDYLNDRSSIVKTFAMQALADLAIADAALWPATKALLEELTRIGTPAMRARGRKLLARSPER